MSLLTLLFLSNMYIFLTFPVVEFDTLVDFSL